MAVEVIRNGVDDAVGVAWCLIGGLVALVAIGSLDSRWWALGVVLQVLSATVFAILAVRYWRRSVVVSNDTVKVRWWFQTRQLPRSDVTGVVWDESVVGWASLVTREGPEVRCPIAKPRRRVGSPGMRAGSELSSSSSTQAFDRLLVLLENSA
jgi:hypothetical protein